MHADMTSRFKISAILDVENLSEKSEHQKENKLKDKINTSLSLKHTKFR